MQWYEETKPLVDLNMAYEWMMRGHANIRMEFRMNVTTSIQYLAASTPKQYLNAWGQNHETSAKFRSHCSWISPNTKNEITHYTLVLSKIIKPRLRKWKSHLRRSNPDSEDSTPPQKTKSHLRRSNPISEDQIPSQQMKSRPSRWNSMSMHEIPSQQMKSRLNRWNPVSADEILSQQIKSRLSRWNPVSESKIPSQNIKSRLKRFNPASEDHIPS